MLDHLVVLGTHLAATLQRVRMYEEHKAAERERELLRKRLVSVQRIEGLALLAGAIAHDFNNMLTVITNSLRFALEDAGVTTRELRADLETALEASDRAAMPTRQHRARRQTLPPRRSAPRGPPRARSRG